MNVERAKKRVTVAVEALNKSIAACLKHGIYPDIAILGESDDWPEFIIENWVQVTKDGENESS